MQHGKAVRAVVNNNKRMEVSLKVEINTASGEGEATRASLRVSDQHCNRRGPT